MMEIVEGSAFYEVEPGTELRYISCLGIDYLGVLSKIILQYLDGCLHRLVCLNNLTFYEAFRIAVCQRSMPD